MHHGMILACVVALGGCARSAINNDPTSDAGGGATSGQNTGTDEGGVSNGEDGGGSPGGTDDGGATAGSDGGTTGGGATACSELPMTCPAAMALGEIDAADVTSKITQMGAGSGWFAVDLADSNRDATANSRIGVGVTLTAPAGATYAVTLMGDTGPNGGGRCVAADVTDTSNPLAQTAIWGSFGPTTASKRVLAVHVEKLTGTCDEKWTLTIAGNPCPALTVGFGEASLGSCD